MCAALGSCGLGVTTAVAASFSLQRGRRAPRRATALSWRPAGGLSAAGVESSSTPHGKAGGIHTWRGLIHIQGRHDWAGMTVKQPRHVQQTFGATKGLPAPGSAIAQWPLLARAQGAKWGVVSVCARCPASCAHLSRKLLAKSDRCIRMMSGSEPHFTRVGAAPPNVATHIEQIETSHDFHIARKVFSRILYIRCHLRINGRNIFGPLPYYMYTVIHQNFTTTTAINAPCTTNSMI